MEKLCQTCHETKPLTEFHKSGGGRFSSQCKGCKSQYWKDRRRDNPLWAKLRDAEGNANRTGVSLAERKRMYEEQGGRCAICEHPGLMFGQGTKRETLPLDHDHLTGEIRGLLCIKCNRGLGLFNDDPELLREAASYLERRRKCQQTD